MYFLLLVQKKVPKKSTLPFEKLSGKATFHSRRIRNSPASARLRTALRHFGRLRRTQTIESASSLHCFSGQFF
jgi:hypothetical protein